MDRTVSLCPEALKGEFPACLVQFPDGRSRRNFGTLLGWPIRTSSRSSAGVHIMVADISGCRVGFAISYRSSAKICPRLATGLAWSPCSSTWDPNLDAVIPLPSGIWPRRGGGLMILGLWSTTRRCSSPVFLYWGKLLRTEGCPSFIQLSHGEPAS